MRLEFPKQFIEFGVCHIIPIFKIKPFMCQIVPQDNDDSLQK